MFNDLQQLDGWHDYSQSSHTNQLKLLSESMDYAPRAFLKNQNKLLPNVCNQRQITEIRSPRGKSLYSSRIQKSQVLYKEDSPLRRRKINQGNINIAPSQFNFTLSQQQFDQISKSREMSPAKQKLNRLAPMLQKMHKIQIKNKIITITHKSPLSQLQHLLDVLNEK